MAETSTTNSKVMIKNNSGLPLSFLPRQQANSWNSWTTRAVMGLMSLRVWASQGHQVQQQMQKSHGKTSLGAHLSWNKIPCETEGSVSSPPSQTTLHSLAAQLGCPGQPKMLLCSIIFNSIILYSISSCAQKLWP